MLVSKEEPIAKLIFYFAENTVVSVVLEKRPTNLEELEVKYDRTYRIDNSTRSWRRS